MTLQQLRYVIGIAKVGSFNKAAENLFIVQKMVKTLHFQCSDFQFLKMFG